jgi:hypothetical protein
MITVATDMTDLLKLKRELIWLGRNALDVAEQAVEDTVKEAESMLTEELASEINAPKPELQERVFASKPSQKTVTINEQSLFAPHRSGQSVQASIGVSGRVIPLRRFSPVQTRAGVSYQPYVRGGRQVVHGSFGPNIHALGRGVFVRRGKSRLPIRRIPGMRLTTDPVAMAAVDKVRTAIPSMLQNNLNSRIRRTNAWRLGVELARDSQMFFGPVFRFRGGFANSASVRNRAFGISRSSSQ